MLMASWARACPLEGRDFSGCTCDYDLEYMHAITGARSGEDRQVALGSSWPMTGNKSLSSNIMLSEFKQMYDGEQLFFGCRRLHWQLVFDVKPRCGICMYFSWSSVSPGSRCSLDCRDFTYLFFDLGAKSAGGDLVGHDSVFSV
ncbi:unnamed protein product [Protopolystoma xenopodis]|uniref:Uncharacterized protein n=1 Tax=Protopolystoma xenopodis TaxID=117903 RepID=A0A3S5AY08_9PLAT|nr:unnamed protein product [Protopolystoma xenopodis]